jgi:hypothetical protein
MLIFGLGIFVGLQPRKEDDDGPTAAAGASSPKNCRPATGLIAADGLLQISPASVVVSGEDHFSVLEKVFKAIDASRHLRPRIYLDKELAYVTEDLAPGIGACRQELDGMLTEREAAPVLHEELIARLDQVARTFRILMIKTDLALPYTSVFMELDCGYWKPESEALMRERMK